MHPRIRRTRFLVAWLLALAAPIVPLSALASPFAQVVQQIESLPYQPDYIATGLDSAFAPALVTNDYPAEDYTTGSIYTAADTPGSPDAPAWPTAFNQVLLDSGDGAPLLGMLALQPGSHPGIVVVHGFNTHGIGSVVRWAAMLYKNGYNVLAADQRDFSFEYQAGYGYPRFPQTFGWKEAQDVVAAGRYLEQQPGVKTVGVVGFSEGAQNTVLALAQSQVFAAGLTFSGPADQDTQIYSTAVPPNCQTPACTYPATDALIALVVPPYNYSDPCSVLDYPGSYYSIDPFSILANETAFHAQTHVSVPLLNFYANDDPLVAPFQASMMAGYEGGKPQQLTLLLQRGAHAYYYDRWWQQEAILLYFKAMLPGAKSDAEITTTATVNQTPGCAAFKPAYRLGFADVPAGGQPPCTLRVQHEPGFAGRRFLAGVMISASSGRRGARAIAQAFPAPAGPRS
jgi:predicted alpha/beta-fold hydrolase